MAFVYGPRRRAKRVWDYWRSEKRTLRQGFVALLISSGGDLLAGLALASMSNRLELLPGLIVLIPAAIGMRGNIFGALGSRLGTGIHSGLFSVSRRREDFLPQNIFASTVLTLATSLFLGVIARMASAAFGLRSISVWDFLVISIVGGVLGSIILGTASVALAIAPPRRDWDLDSVSAPLVTAIGDTCTLPALWAASYLTDLRYVTFTIAMATGAFCLVMLIRGFVTDLPLARRIVRESLPVLFVAGVVDILAGTVVESRIERFIAFPALLVLIPPFLEDTGALGGILSARLSSKIHLGLVGPSPWPDSLTFLDAGLVGVSGLFAFTATGALALLFSVAAGKAHPGAAVMVGGTLAAGVIATIISIVVSYYIAILTTRFGLDPDNHAVPVITSVMDLVGVLTFLAVLSVLGVAAHV